MDVVPVKTEGMTQVQIRRQQRAARAKAISGTPSYDIGSNYESPDEFDNDTKQISDIRSENAEISENPHNGRAEPVEEEPLLVVEGDKKRGQGLTHTKSLPPERKSSRNFAQRKCDDLSKKLTAAETANLELQEKISELEKNRDMLIHDASELQAENDRLDKSLLAKEDTCKALKRENVQLSNSLLQVRENLAAEQRDKRGLKQQIHDLEEERKRLNEANYALQEKHDPCQSEIAELRSVNATYYRKGTGYLQQRNELREDVATLTATIDSLKLEVQDIKQDLQESELARRDLAHTESKFRDAARAWNDKYRKASQENADLIKYGSKLAEENSALRHEHSVADDSMLKASLSSLNYDIREWCDRVVEAKPPGTSAYLSNPPFTRENDYFLTELGDKELNALIACVWEWLLKLVLGPEILPDGRVKHPDLWTDNNIRSCLSELENRFASKDQIMAVHWRHRTVQQISRVGLSNDEAGIEDVVDKIFHWVTTKCFELVGPAEQLQELRRTLRDQVILKAVAFALDLRRQDSVISVNIPQTVGQALMCVPIVMGIRPSGPDDTLLKLCITPQLKRYNFGSAAPEASGSIIVEAVSVNIPMKPLKPAGLKTFRQREEIQDQSTLDIDID